MVRKRYVNPFDKETELCAHFAKEAENYGWLAYPETENFDLLLVATELVHGQFNIGDQIGIQAKLVPNIEVLYQSLPRPLHWRGPNYYGVLIPKATREFREVAAALKIKVFEAAVRNWKQEWEPGPIRAFASAPRTWPEHKHKKPCWVPDVHVEMEAGAASPKQLTPWKLKAVKLALHGVTKGYLTSHDFSLFDVSMSRWVRLSWILPKDFVVEDGKRRRRFLLNDRANPPHLKFPEVAAALKG